MKSVRIEIALLMYHLLSSKGSFSKEEVLGQMSISLSSFNRAVSDFRCYLLDMEPDKELIYISESGVYRLIPVDPIHF